MTKGKFIVLEGIDGSGKSTQADLLIEKLNEHGIRSIKNSEPTDKPIGKLLRKYLKGEHISDPLAVAALFTSDRLDHITSPDGLLSLLNSGTTVVCDRYYFSSYAYNAHGLPVSDIISLNAPCAKLLRPDLTVYIDIPVQAALNRIFTGRPSDAIEIYESSEYLNTVAQRYTEAFSLTSESEDVYIINGDCDADSLSCQIFERILQLW